MRIYSFDQLIGNQHCISILKTCITQGTLPHFMIFHGVGGTGKSTCAEITALAMTCPHTKEGNPCLECISCKSNLDAIKHGTKSSTVAKVNVAQGNTKTDVDRMIKEIFTLQSSDRNCVYVLEEAHTLSAALQTSLLEEIDEIKSSLSGGSGRDAFGIRSMFTNAMQGGGQYGTGLDAIVGFLLSLLPDVKKYSDYNPERMAYNVQEEDSCTTYMLKTAIPTIMLIFFFAMGYNGTLWQGFGVIVDAMGTAAEQLVATDLNSIVSTAMNTGKAYKFSWDASGSDYGNFMQDMVKAVYKQALKNGKDYTSDTQQSVGSYVDSIFLTGKGYSKSDMKLYKGSTNEKISIGKGKGSIFTDADTLAKAIGNTTGFKGEDDAKNLTYTVISNSTKDSYKISNAVEVVISAYDVGLNSSANGNYIHVTISRKKNSDETMYWHKADDGAKPTKNGTKNSSSGTNTKNSGKQ